MKFGPAVQEMSFSDISFLELWQTCCSVDWNQLCNLEEGIMRNKPVKLFRTWTSGSGGNAVKKVFLVWSCGSPFIQRSVTICVILVEGIQRNNSVRFFLNLGQWFRRCRLKDFLSEALVALLFGGAEPCMQF